MSIFLCSILLFEPIKTSCRTQSESPPPPPPNGGAAQIESRSSNASLHQLDADEEDDQNVLLQLLNCDATGDEFFSFKTELEATLGQLSEFFTTRERQQAEEEAEEAAQIDWKFMAMVRRVCGQESSIRLTLADARSFLLVFLCIFVGRPAARNVSRDAAA